jgi:ligand-binding SRPBCC domain-containing protein
VFKKVFESVIPCSVVELWEFHSDPKVLDWLTPPSQRLTPVGEMKLEDGALHVLSFKLFGVIPQEWRARISDVHAPYGFVDTAEKSPFVKWRHHHEFAEHPEGALLRDTLDYLPPLAWISHPLVVSRQIDELFAFRHRRTREAILAKKAG